MNKFNKIDIAKIQESSSGKDNQLLVDDYKVQNLDVEDGFSYGLFKKKSKKSKEDLDVKSSRFKLSEFSRTKRSVQEEEKLLINKKVQKKINEIEESAIKKGYDEGYRQGQIDGVDIAKQDFFKENKGNSEVITRFANELDSLKMNMYNANEKFLIDLVFKISKMLALKDIQSDRNFITRLIKQVIENLNNKESIKIQINPKDKEVVSSLSDELTSKFSELKNFDIVTSNDVEQGGCVLDTDWSRVDANLETQFNQVYNSLMEVEGDVESA